LDKRFQAYQQLLVHVILATSEQELQLPSSKRSLLPPNDKPNQRPENFLSSKEQIDWQNINAK